MLSKEKIEMEIKMKNAIQSIVNEVPKRCIFDSHFIINELVKKHSDKYLVFASDFAKADEQITPVVHGQIAQAINALDGIKRLENKSWSENIHGNSNECACWEKL